MILHAMFTAMVEAKIDNVTYRIKSYGYGYIPDIKFKEKGKEALLDGEKFEYIPIRINFKNIDPSFATKNKTGVNLNYIIHLKIARTFKNNTQDTVTFVFDIEYQNVRNISSTDLKVLFDENVVDINIIDVKVKLKNHRRNQYVGYIELYQALQNDSCLVIKFPLQGSTKQSQFYIPILQKEKLPSDNFHAFGYCYGDTKGFDLILNISNSEALQNIPYDNQHKNNQHKIEHQKIKFPEFKTFKWFHNIRRALKDNLKYLVSTSINYITESFNYTPSESGEWISIIEYLRYGSHSKRAQSHTRPNITPVSTPHKTTMGESHHSQF